MGRQATYDIKKKRNALRLIEKVGTVEAERLLSIPRRALRGWEERTEAIFAFTGSEKRKTTGGQGAKEIFPFAHNLILFMKDVRRSEEILSSIRIIFFIKQSYGSWLKGYMDDKDSTKAFNALMRLCQRFAHGHGFSQRTPSFAKLPRDELLAARLDFAGRFWATYGEYQPSGILNVDETGVFLGDPPRRSWSEIGSSVKVLGSPALSPRITAVLTVRADGSKLPLLFIVKGKPGGTIEQRELGLYPHGHHYAVQQNAWMDQMVWRTYVMDCLRYEISSPSVLLLDNLSPHVSDEGQELVVTEACCTVCLLPANTTSVCQPLDAGVIGPFKAKLRALWLRETFHATTAAGKRLQMIKRAISAWEAIDEDTVRSSFHKAIPRVPRCSSEQNA